MYPPQAGYPSQPPQGYPYQQVPGDMYQTPGGAMQQPPPGGPYQGVMYQPVPGGAYQGAMYQPPPGGAYPVGVYQQQPNVMYQPAPGAAYPLQPGVMYPLPGGAGVHPQPVVVAGSGWMPNHEQIPNAHVAAANNWAVKVAPIEASSAPDPNGGIQTGRWSNGLCDCCNVIVPNCLMSCCCPCVVLAQVYARIGITSYKVALGRVVLVGIPIVILRFIRSSSDGSDDSGALTTVVLLVTLLLEGIFSLLVCYARIRVRRRFFIDGNCCEDYCVSACCTCCAIAQMATHSRSYRPGDCSFGGPAVLPPYPV